MIVCGAGDIHGAIGRFYGDVLAFEAALGRRFDWLLHVGDFGVWPDPTRLDRATRNYEGAGDFPSWFAEGRPVPRPTVFIKGNHDDFEWLEAHRGSEVLSGLTYLPNGNVLDLRSGDEVIRVGGLGGCYGPSDYDRPARSLQGYGGKVLGVEVLLDGELLADLLEVDAQAQVLLDEGFGIEDAVAGCGFAGEERCCLGARLGEGGGGTRDGSKITSAVTRVVRI